MPDFSHLHVHTQFSLLDGAADISRLFKKAQDDGMKALAITDHGNMFGAFKFVAEASKYNVKPIVGCEFYVVDDRHQKTFNKDKRDKRYHQLLLAKNATGYKNLAKLCSLGYIEGLYSKWPRIDKELILKYHEGLIATTCCIGASVPQAILNKGEDEAEKEFKWWLDIFGEDYYIELQRHNIDDQNKINEVLLKFALKHNVKIICSNDSHYVDQADANAHDILLCVNTGEKQTTPIATDEEGGKGFRFGFPNDQFYFKTQTEMGQLFSDLPQALDNTNEIVDKVEVLKLKQDILLPNFPVPDQFKIHTASEFHKDTELKPDVLNQWEYLKHLTWEGAKQRYSEITPDIEERINFELFTIKTMGFAGYFLIVSDFIRAGRDLGVFIGPGRGSAAGSVVAYCIGITNIDPVKYNLLFERFLNPDRKSMPDIDTDFDDEGRQKVIDYVVDKYGKNQVAQIVTYGTMAAKMSIKDVARVLDLPLNESNGLAKLVPERPGISLERVMTAPISGEKSLEEKEGLSADELENVKRLREIAEGRDLSSKVLKEALVLEGSVRGTGIHAAGIIIAPSDLTEILPVCTSKESELLITQYEGKVIEDAGVIKMDFLGLKTLTIIRDALKLIKQNHNLDIDIDAIPLDDAKTFELYQRADTNGTFQFESAGMQKYLRELKPDKFEDLIAMNALYRPGPLEYIPKFILRKHGREEVTYDLQEMKEYLEETYGITVYQEQVMLLSQSIGGFSKGDADVLRKAMGKKDRATLDKMKGKFMEGATSKGFDAKILEKVWTDWEAFAQYAFNKSHSTCYAFVAYQTAYLKAHYPAEYMAAVLTHNVNNIDKISFFMEECQRIGVPVLGPDINESDLNFSVNKKGEIRFGMGAVKGVGEAASLEIIREREARGLYKNIFDLTKRANLRSVNKKTLECLAKAGAFDFDNDYHRAQYVSDNSEGGVSGIELAIRYGARYQETESSNQGSLFGGSSSVTISEPQLPKAEPFGMLEECRMEKEMVGIFISKHPLDTYKIEAEYIASHRTTDLADLNAMLGKTITLAGMITSANNLMTKSGSAFAKFTLEDYAGSYEFAVFGKDYDQFRMWLYNENFIMVKVAVQRRPFGAQEPEAKIIAIEKLEEVKTKYLKGLEIQLDVSEFSTRIVDELEKKFALLQGSSSINITLTDKQKNMKVDMYSADKRVNICSELLDFLNAESIRFTVLKN